MLKSIIEIGMRVYVLVNYDVLAMIWVKLNREKKSN